MVPITAALVKDLRERTGAGIMDCKKVLTDAHGDIDLAIRYMRQSGIIKGAEKTKNIASEGLIRCKIIGNNGVILEINCQTDFVVKDVRFQLFADKVLDAAIFSNVIDAKKLEDKFQEERMSLISHFGENINIRRIVSLEGSVLGSYVHNQRIGVLVSLTKSSTNFAKKIAMHIAASKPEFISPQDVSPKILEKEYQVQLEIAMQSGKAKEIAEKIVKGRMQKFIREISLTSQPFILDLNKDVGQCLAEEDAIVNNFIRFEVGEGIKKKESNFAKEVSVLAQITK
ncbi:translation elongation factor Ts [Candidatus Erwinia haradaeae]|uniref:Elongation factor Ts n=1 Tax=Candidatus Erwinia haradaeae TaxID=1922217 RepID=A0A451DL15_9GAMM|nr:translation elongation factor Ts [Candidatus Erwinia haradaeae]VFP87414.1 Elongation factor Ts [Candidatus Erwinia haradaeae]